MNVKVETVPVEDPSDPTKKMQRTILVATKDFKAGDEIYKVRSGPTYVLCSNPVRRNNQSQQYST